MLEYYLDFACELTCLIKSIHKTIKIITVSLFLKFPKKLYTENIDQTNK